MENKKLVLSTKKFKADSTTIISARVPTELLKKIEDLAETIVVRSVLNFFVESTNFLLSINYHLIGFPFLVYIF